MKKQAYMKFVLLIAAVFLLALGPVQAMAADKALSMDDAAAVLKNFDPSIQVKSVEPSSIDGLSEVIVIVKGEVGIVYIASDKKHVILGSIVDAATKNNITKARFEAVKAKYTPKVDFGAIPLDDAVVMGDPKAAHKVVVFDDPSWPYCAKLHQVMKQIQKDRSDVVFYLKMFPLVQIHKDAYDQSKAILCAKQKDGDEAALKLLEDAYAHKALPKPSCETDDVDKSLKTGQGLGLRGTPAMVFEDGSMIKGAVSAGSITQKLDSLK